MALSIRFKKLEKKLKYFSELQKNSMSSRPLTNLLFLLLYKVFCFLKPILFPETMAVMFGNIHIR